MKRFDFVDGIDAHDQVLYYFDGEYSGHDDQVEFGDLTPPGTQAAIVVSHWMLTEDWDGECPEQLDDLRPFLVPLAESE